MIIVGFIILEPSDLLCLTQTLTKLRNVQNDAKMFRLHKNI